ncbi:MAG: inositol 2-dehydrogenase [Limnochordia bacterium]|jgi:myo-inositol 2-dehydrogenase/D-chiro-inositol 1-dehydrogenase
MANRINLGIIGAGRIGRLHAENIIRHIPKAKIRIIADLYPDQVQTWAKDFDIPRITADYREVLDDLNVEAVLICSSTDTHADFIIEAAEADKHIFCEKPIDLSIDRIKAALAVVEQRGVKLQVGFNRRFDHNHRKVRDMVAGGKIGEPHIIQITSRDPSPPPMDYLNVSGGLFLDMTIHDFDMARFLSGSEVEEVYALGDVLIDPAIGQAGDIDTAIVTLKFASGAMGVINNSRRATYGYDQRVEVFGSKGGVLNRNDTPSSAILSTGEGVISEKPKYFFLERYKESFILEMMAFIDAVLCDADPPVDGEDGLKAALIAVAARESLKQNRPVKIGEID